MIPELVLSAGRGSQVAIISPWIENVTLLPPRFGIGGVSYRETQITFSDFFIRMVRDFSISVIFLVRPGDRRTRATLQRIVTAAPNRVVIKEFDYIHAKGVVTPHFALETTANIIPTSLFRNIELCTLVRNTFKDTRRYINHKLGDII